jgi:hypothetical protein
MFAASYFAKTYFAGVYFPPVVTAEVVSTGGGLPHGQKRKRRHLEALILEDEEFIGVMQAFIEMKRNFN